MVALACELEYDALALSQDDIDSSFCEQCGGYDLPVDDCRILGLPQCYGCAPECALCGEPGRGCVCDPGV